MRGDVNEFAQPAGVAAGACRDLDDRWKIVEQRIERLAIARKETANEFRRDRALRADIDIEGLLDGAFAIETFRIGLFGAHAGLAGHNMRIAAREHDDLSGFDRNRILPDEIGIAMPLGNHVIGDEMTRAGQNLRKDVGRRRLLGDPRRTRANVEKHRARQSYGFQHI